MFTAPAHLPAISDPPAPVTGGMRWRRQSYGHEAFWADWIRTRRETAERTGAPFREPATFIPPRDEFAELRRPRKTPDKEQEEREEREETEEPPAYALYIISAAPPPEGRVGEEYTYDARAYDGNTNGFTWRLTACPPGMTVNRHTGRVRWTPDNGGWFEITLCARSLYGKEARQSWTVCIRKAAVIRTPKPAPRFLAALRRRRLTPRAPIPAPWRDCRRQIAADRRATSPPGERTPRHTAMPLRR